MASPFYITTPIYYVNARPHLGHAYTTIVADTAKRYHQLRGQDAYFLTGTDEHGDKVVEAAEKENKEVRDYVDMISGLFRNLWPELLISNDQFIRTTDADHIKVVQEVLQKIYDNGDIYFSEYEGLYCFGCERFYLERELVDGKCPDHEVEPKKIKESNYFFRMSKYQDWLIDHIKKNPGFIRPQRYANEVLSFLKEPLEDLCISRPKTRLTWGIDLPFDENYVTYVWFDALLNYASALGYPEGEKFQKYWPGVQHVVAKDILKPHGIYWPTMMKAAGIPVYNHLNVHGYWNVADSKMSKSLGNVVEPLELSKKYGIEQFRYFLMREMTFGLDSSFSEEALVGRINSDLANDLGNLFSRVVSMAHKFCKGTVPENHPDLAFDSDWKLSDAAMEAVEAYDLAMDEFQFHKGLAAVWEFISRMNKYVDFTAPWVLAKDKAAAAQLEAVMYNLLEGLRLVAGMVWPVLPNAAETMVERLGLNKDAFLKDSAALGEWGVLKPGTQLQKAVTLFPRIDVKKMEEKAPEKKQKAPKTPELKPEIDIEDFGKVDLRVGTIIEAQAVPKANKLLQLTVDLGEPEPRTVVAGIAKAFEPQDLAGQQVIVVANLKPAKLMGITSQGMVVAAVNKKGVIGLSTVNTPVPPGTTLR
ncbi:methionyl-tRNA synthetase [Desulfatibacillum alkenivorans DSM 16219]|uniref:Methionine--tRNA ligase n=1 Tax=Desulfatibacillum alkenivorans DSM 16219 TaxID=1121393 RepID=A0A1M6CG90_9BACT|nr:methionine--tRNA ligase [Desulfatibacillum alkenivorans]SHI59943.1 methionyl-tRNA synthetase [Desulfatibacillum alkenivorans DSM 16219]